MPELVVRPKRAGRCIALVAALAGAAVLPGALSAQLRDAGAVERAHAAAPEARAVRTSQPLTVDGRLSEPAWQTAQSITSFTQVDPEEGRPVSQRTDVRLLFDDDALYVGAVLRDTVAVSSRLGRRDAYLQDSDWFSISLDTHHDHRTAYRFMVNPSGVRSDEVLSGGDDRGDDSWDPVWAVETATSDSGWVVEMRIPFSQLRFGDARTQVWGIQLEREIGRRQEEAVFSFTPKSERGGIARFGHLAGLEGIERGRGLELLPYGIARAEYVDAAGQPGAAVANPYRDGADYHGGFGLDMKYRLTSDLTLDVAVNPEFGQVEVDPAVVNLTAYETRFDEKRPFFVEGAGIFAFGDAGGWGGGTQLLYSRRIGASPSWREPDEAIYHDVPDAATIVAAAKLTGRTAGGWSVGLLEAVTGEEAARYVDAAGEESEAVAAPPTNYLAARLQRNLREGRTVLGGMATAVHRRVADLPLAADLRAAAYTGGLDFRHEWADRAWSLSGYVAASRIAGSPEAIEDAQRSSARYFQRPDARHVELDARADVLQGYTANLELSKEAGLHWRGRAELSATSPGFEANDLGFQRDADRVEASASIRYVENRPGRVFRDWSVDASPSAGWNYGREYLGSRISVELEGELLSYWGGEIEFAREFPGLDDRLTRGGPAARDVAGNQISAELRSDARRRWQVRADLSRDWDAAGGRETEIGLDLELRPAASWSVSIGPELSRERAAAQYLGAVEDPHATATFGRRYLFAALEQTTLALETRLDVAFRPGLTLQLYAQPFLAAADFGGLMELRAPRTFSFLRYGRDAGTITAVDGGYRVDPDGDGPAAPFELEDEDFNRRSLRGNAVLRWEWKPGSTLFLVWQQRRSAFQDRGDFDAGRDARALFRARPENVFLFKLNYWLSP